MIPLIAPSSESVRKSEVRALHHSLSDRLCGSLEGSHSGRAIVERLQGWWSCASNSIKYLHVKMYSSTGIQWYKYVYVTYLLGYVRIYCFDLFLDVDSCALHIVSDIKCFLFIRSISCIIPIGWLIHVLCTYSIYIYNSLYSFFDSRLDCLISYQPIWL